MGWSATEVTGGRAATVGGDGPSSDGASFERWYRAVHPRLVAALLLSSGRADDAAEVADETMVRALEHWDRVGAMASPDGWAFRVAFNLVRRRGRRQALERVVLRRASAGRPDSLAGPAGEAWLVVRDLAPRQRQVVVLRYVVDLPEAAIADALGISRGSVSSALADARSILRTRLSDVSEGSEP